MAIENLNSTAQRTLSGRFFGTAISFILHGVTTCQMIWFFRFQSSRSSKWIKALVIFVWLSEALNCAFMFVATLDTFLLPAITYAVQYTSPCTDWVARAQTIPTTLCTCTVEGFFIFRVWKLSEHKKLTIILFIPYLVTYGFVVAQTVRTFQQRCNPTVVDIDQVLVFSANGLRILSDGVVVATMCYILYRRSSRFTSNTNTIRVVRGLILWSISTGVLTWITNVLLLLSVLIPFGFTVYFVRGGVYANAMLAQLNARTRFRAMADASIPLNSIGLGPSSSTTLPVDQELQPLTLRT